MIIKANRHLNLHSATYNSTRADNSGLVHVAANVASVVPDDVQDHPSFKILVNSGTVSILKRAARKVVAKPQTEVGKALEPEIKPLVDEDDSPLISEQDSSKIPSAETAGVQQVPDQEAQAPDTKIPQAEEIDEEELDEEE